MMPRPAFWWVAAGITVLAVALAPDTSIPARWALLYQLHPHVRPRFLALLRRIEALGWTVVLTSAWRPTDTSLGYHYFGLGLDLNAERGPAALRMATPKATWEASGIPALIRAAGFRWGGDFRTTPYDPVHVDLGNTYDVAVLRALARANAPGDLAHFDARTLPLPRAS